MKATIDEVKSGSKVTLSLLKTFMTQFQKVEKLPEGLIKTSVHSRVIARGDTGEHKTPVDSKPRINRSNDNPGYNKNPRARRNYNEEDMHRGGGGRGRGNRPYMREQTEVHDAAWLGKKDELQQKMS